MAVSNAFTSAGTTLAIGAAPATYDAAGFAAVTFTAISEITEIGAFGKKFNVVNHMPIGDRRVVKRKGSYNNGTLSLKMARSRTSDAGQTALRAASESDLSYSFKMTLPNSVVVYFTGQVVDFSTNVGSVDQILGLESTVEIDNDIIEV